MSKHSSQVEDYARSVRFPDVSGIEILELLILRSLLAEVEQELTPTERGTLETADATLLRNAPALFRRVSEVGPLETLRKDAGVRPFHWWWYLDTLVRVPVS